MNEDMREQLRADLLADFEELLYLAITAGKQFVWFKKKIVQIKKYLPPAMKEVDAELLLWEKKNIIYTKAIRLLIKQLPKASSNDLKKSIEKKEYFIHALRMHYGILASLITIYDWQSPSYLYAKTSMAGKETGAIIATFNDYKRDLHRDGLLYENAFTKEYITKFLFVKKALLTSSGMSAFTTVINFLHMEGKMEDTILIGKSIYFENKEIIRKLFPKQIIEVDESQTSNILSLIKKKQPSVIILDSLSNTADVMVPDLVTLVTEIDKIARKEITMVIDNTCLSTSVSLLHIFQKRKHISPLFFESMNKYHQFGMDRVTGGIIYTNKQLDKLFLAREHLGTNISDASVYALPIPNKKILQKRLARLNRNTRDLASYLNTAADKGIVERIVHPSLPSHPSFSWTKKMSFTGSFFVIRFTKPYRKIATYQNFVQCVIRRAKEKKVNITAGTSFGLSNTRVYVTALSDIYGEPFLRIALGTETVWEMEILKEIFLHALKQTYKKRLFR